MLYVFLNQHADKPQPESSYQDKVVTEGDPVQLNCSVMGNPSPSYTWRCPSDSHCTSNGSVFVRKSIQLSEKGLYTCSVNNIMGNVTIFFNVDVRRKFFVWSSPFFRFSLLVFLESKLLKSSYSNVLITAVMYMWHWFWTSCHLSNTLFVFTFIPHPTLCSQLHHVLYGRSSFLHFYCRCCGGSSIPILQTDSNGTVQPEGCFPSSQATQGFAQLRVACRKNMCGQSGASVLPAMWAD